MGVLDVADLDVKFAAADGEVHAVRNFSLSLAKGECVGIVGESGSGKSQTCLAIMGLLAENGKASGSVRVEGEEILNAPRHVLNRIRGDRIGLIFQDPMSSLTPFMRVGEQMCEGLIYHQGLSPAKARERVLEVLELVRIPDAKRRFQQYPHELSGGMKQRVVIAQAILCKPAVLIADEPTTALDVTVQAQILEILDGLRRHTDTAILLITHDLGVVAGMCDRVMVMYGGRVVEEASAEAIFEAPHHPYTQGLLASMPTLTLDPTAMLPAIPGQPPSPLALPPGCSFAPRCPHAESPCMSDAPPLRSIGEARRSACLREAAYV